MVQKHVLFVPSDHKDVRRRFEASINGLDAIKVLMELGDLVSMPFWTTGILKFIKWRKDMKWNDMKWTFWVKAFLI